jgi:hypothetical protein
MTEIDSPTVCGSPRGLAEVLAAQKEVLAATAVLAALVWQQANAGVGGADVNPTTCLGKRWEKVHSKRWLGWSFLGDKHRRKPAATVFVFG